jgi:hypothetical protein
MGRAEALRTEAQGFLRSHVAIGRDNTINDYKLKVEPLSTADLAKLLAEE